MRQCLESSTGFAGERPWDGARLGGGGSGAAWLGVLSRSGAWSVSQALGKTQGAIVKYLAEEQNKLVRPFRFFSAW